MSFLVFIGFCVIGLLYIAAVGWKRGSDKSSNILNLRNCQQAMRGHEGMNNLITGKPFTRSDLEKYMPFPRDVNTDVTYTPGDKVTGMGVLWLRVSPQGDIGGTYGPAAHEIADW